ncbi:MAG: bifunctional (p)ppGpp synthetase/guanosine-3',5'-bis(diphosphate) 3'-pyrophosphohydrolase [Oscillospiraceae bacterium]|nr:bifunctional (p)ppGpp synthetase/guanosine-3',5'-bis(diphosphate) 3'-pyrophosphohydrolase [Oscillospiraceae bacterium]
MPETFDPIVERQYAALENKINAAGMKVDHGRIRAAFELAAASHAGQKRKDGTPYVTHCIAAADITVDMGLDEDSIVSALLHDTIEDTAVTHEQIAKQFGPDVANIVEGVTKLTRVNYTSREEEQMENMRKMLLAMSRDIRVILIKLADRLHNMRTMDYQSPEKQRLKSLETMEIYAPIAHRLGIQAVKWELEDLALKYLDPVAFQAITSSIAERRGDLDAFMDRMERKIKARLSEWGIHCTIYHRIKHTYSIYRKMYRQKLQLSEIWDICALRVIVDALPDCYAVLGLVHDMFNTVPGKFKDYISMPKPNGYQSLQTTVIGTEAIPFEVQIRTWEMHRTAEYGVAAHWKYKSGPAGVREGDEEEFAWVRRLLETQQDSDADDFFSGLKVDMFADEVFVFSPKGDVTSLPAGATPVDFAYSVHSAVGNRMVGAKVNGRIVPYGQELHNGDIVEILTSKSAPGPSRDWLKIAKSGSARTKIKQWLKKERREENIVQGKELLEAELRRAGITMAEVNEFDLLPPILKKQSFSNVDDLYAAVGYGGMTAPKVANRLKDELLKARRSAADTGKTALDKVNEAAERRNQKDPPKPRPINGVLIAGLDNCLLKFARCCTPVAGDDIVGFITRGYGVSIHRSDCKNHIAGRLHPDGEGRWVDAAWDMSAAETYITTVYINSIDRNSLVMDIALVLSSMNAKVRSLNARAVGGGMASTTLTLEVRNLDELKAIIARLATVPGVKKVGRSNG